MSEPVSQSRPDSGLGLTHFSEKVFKTIQVVPFSLASGLGIQPRVKSLRSSYRGLYPQTFRQKRCSDSTLQDMVEWLVRDVGYDEMWRSRPRRPPSQLFVSLTVNLGVVQVWRICAIHPEPQSLDPNNVNPEP